MSIFGGGEKKENILIIDIQSSMVRASIWPFVRGQESAISYSANNFVYYRSGMSTAKLVENTVKAIHDVVGDCLKKIDDKRFAAVHFVLSSPWIMSRTVNIQETFPRRTVVSRKLVANVVKREREKMSPIANGPVDIIEEKILDVRLNGYHVDHWDGKEADSFEVSFSVSVAGSVVVNELMKACEEIVSRDKIAFHSSFLMTKIGLSLVRTDMRSYSLVNIHGELTDLAIVNNNECVFFGSYPIGSNSIIGMISQKLGLNTEAADSALLMKYNGDIEPANDHVAEKAMEEVLNVWSEEMKKLILENKNELFGQDLIVVYATRHEKFFTEGIANIAPRSHTISIHSLLTSPILPKFPGAKETSIVAVYALAIDHIHNTGL